MTRRIAVFTGIRADYGQIRLVLAELTRMPGVETVLLVSGAHLSAAHGGTLSEVERDGFARILPVPIDLSDDSPVGIGHYMGRALSAYVDAFARVKPDLVAVLGDRYEAFCAVAAATVLCLPVAHLFGGEITRGAMDDVFRHAMTKMSHMHFTACEVYRERVIRMGEAPERVWNVGSLGVENAHLLPPMSGEEIRQALALPPDAKYLVATYHPVTLEAGTAERHVKALIDALDALSEGEHVVFTGANTDAGGWRVNEILRERAARGGRFRFFMSLGVFRYVNAVRNAAGVVGNSSSGVIEVPSLGTPVLNIGNRQEGRLCSEAVLHCGTDRSAIDRGLERLLSPETAEAMRKAKNPYDRPNTARNIAQTLAAHPLDDILRKRFYDDGSRR